MLQFYVKYPEFLSNHIFVLYKDIFWLFSTYDTMQWSLLLFKIKVYVFMNHLELNSKLIITPDLVVVWFSSWYKASLSSDGFKVPRVLRSRVYCKRV